MNLFKLIPVGTVITHITVNDPIRVASSRSGITYRAEIHQRRTWLGLKGFVSETGSFFCYSPTGSYWHYNEPNGEYVPKKLDEQINAAKFEKEYRAAEVDAAFNKLAGTK